MKNGGASEDRERGHLTFHEVSQWLVEGPSAEADGHLQHCWMCQAKLAEARQPLAAFRGAVVAWSEAQSAVSGKMAARLRNRLGSRDGRGIHGWMQPVSFALGAVLLAALLIGGSVLHRRPVPQQVASAPAVSDAALMDQVDAEVSEAVPDAMAPLTALVAWDSNEDAADGRNVGKPAGKGKPELNSNGRVTD